MPKGGAALRAAEPKKKDMTLWSCPSFWWRRGESNSRPKTLPWELLRAQTVIAGVLLSPFPSLAASRHAVRSGELHDSWPAQSFAGARAPLSTPAPGPWSCRVDGRVKPRRELRYYRRSFIYKGARFKVARRHRPLFPLPCPRRNRYAPSSSQAPYPSLPAKAESSLISLLLLSKPNPLALGFGLGRRLCRRMGENCSGSGKNEVLEPYRRALRAGTGDCLPGEDQTFSGSG